MVLLCSRFPKVRAKTADTLYDNLMIFGDLILEDEEEKLEVIMRLLSETVWLKSEISKLKEIRKSICINFNITEPSAVKRS